MICLKYKSTLNWYYCTMNVMIMKTSKVFVNGMNNNMMKRRK